MIKIRTTIEFYLMSVEIDREFTTEQLELLGISELAEQAESGALKKIMSDSSAVKVSSKLVKEQSSEPTTKQIRELAETRKRMADISEVRK